MKIEKQTRLFYNLKGILTMLLPANEKGFDAILREAAAREDYEEILTRADYYSNVASPLDLATSEPLREFCFAKKGRGTVYFFDLFKVGRNFDQNLLVKREFCDCSWGFNEPTLCKNRPILPRFDRLGGKFGGANSTLLNFDGVRHFVFVKDEVEFKKKSDKIFWRGAAYQPWRHKMLQTLCGKPFADVGDTAKTPFNEGFVKPRASLAQHLQHKFILSPEGNDVATNLKWIMSSNSVALMPPPRFESWFCEAKLKPWVHYAPLKEDYSDAESVREKLLGDSQLCEEIVRNANAWCAQFREPRREFVTGVLTLAKYFQKTNQGEFF